jgi:hypothetical protein
MLNNTKLFFFLSFQKNIQKGWVSGILFYFILFFALPHICCSSGNHIFRQKLAIIKNMKV